MIFEKLTVIWQLFVMKVWMKFRKNQRNSSVAYREKNRRTES